jgi:hypothetical protein
VSVKVLDACRLCAERKAVRKIVRISYEHGGAFKVRLDDNTDAVAPYMVHQLAIDAAFERRAPVEPEVVDPNQIILVHTDRPPTGIEEPPPPGSVVITRIQTEVQADLGAIAEVFFADPFDPRVEKPSRTNDLVIHLLCHSAYLSQHPLRLTLDADGLIKEVIKGL